MEGTDVDMQHKTFAVRVEDMARAKNALTAELWSEQDHVSMVGAEVWVGWHAGADLDKHQHTGRIVQYQIDLAALAAIIAFDHRQAARLQIAQRAVLIGLAGGGAVV